MTDERFDPETIEELTGYTVQDIIFMYRDYDRAVKENERFQKILDADGASDFDKICHTVYSEKGNNTNYLLRGTGVKCSACGHELEYYYCESRLYLVECSRCGKKALVKAASPERAAYRTFAEPVYSIDEFPCEELGVFFDHTPIDEPPVYVGSPIDCGFPDDVVCGMILPCPGTDGSEIDAETD